MPYCSAESSGRYSSFASRCVSQHAGLEGQTCAKGEALADSLVDSAQKLIGRKRNVRQFEQEQWPKGPFNGAFWSADGNSLKFIMRSELGEGPLSLLKLKGYRLPELIFSVGPDAVNDALVSTEGQ